MSTEPLDDICERVAADIAGVVFILFLQGVFHLIAVIPLFIMWWRASKKKNSRMPMHSSSSSIVSVVQ